MDSPGTHQPTDVDAYFEETIVQPDAVFSRVQERAEAAGLPDIEVSAPMGKFLGLIATISGAQHVLEVGTLAGFSSIWMARAVGPEGHVTSCEFEPDHAEVARRNLADAGVSERVDIRLGDAENTLLGLLEEYKAGQRQPFDLVFLDADKAGNSRYLELALQMSRPGTVIIGDNVTWDGEVLEASSEDSDIQGIRQFLGMQGQDPRLEATAIQTVGAKGWDGFSIAVVTGTE